MLSVFIHLTPSSFWKNVALKFPMHDCLVAVRESDMRIFHCALTCRRRGFPWHFFYRAEKWDKRMKVEAIIPQPEREWGASLGMTCLMQDILLGGKTLAYIPEGLRLTLWLENTTVPCTLRGYLNWHIGSLPGILQHISRKERLSFLRSHCNFVIQDVAKNGHKFAQYSFCPLWLSFSCYIQIVEQAAVRTCWTFYASLHIWLIITSWARENTGLQATAN